MNGTSPIFLKAIPLILLLLTASDCAAFSEDIKTLTKKAKGGDVKAQFNLGLAHYNGKEVPKNYGEAAKWLQKAAEQGYALAQYNLGILYDKGQGVPQNHAKAAKWWQKAAEQGIIEAQSNLGVHYYKGQGVPQDYLLAYFWYSLSASRITGKTYEESAKLRDQVAKDMTPEQLMKAQQMTHDWEAKHPRK